MHCAFRDRGITYDTMFHCEASKCSRTNLPKCVSVGSPHLWQVVFPMNVHVGQSRQLHFMLPPLMHRFCKLSLYLQYFSKQVSMTHKNHNDGFQTYPFLQLLNCLVIGPTPTINLSPICSAGTLLRSFGLRSFSS